jgi:ethanolamine utilization protein EutP (predicted NTPase)
MDNEKIMVPSERIEQSILLIRRQKVMLDNDLTALYGVPTKVLNQAIRRNVRRFPPDFMFRLTKKEKLELVTKCDLFQKLKHSSSLPCAFTEQGVAMLSNVLNSRRGMRVKSQNNKCFSHFNSAGPF